MMIHRPRILRKNSAIRSLVAETSIQMNDLIVPLFVIEGTNQIQEIASMPQYFRYSLDALLEEVKELRQLGVQSVLLFTQVEAIRKDNTCKEAYNEQGLMARAIQAIKKEIPDMYVMTDVALDPFSPYGHDGLVAHGEILNDETIDVLCKMALMHASMGADMVAPSDMMDGRIGALRQAFENKGYTKMGIMAYSAKYASCYYGPFRDALDSAPGFGDKKTYQMDYRNRKEAIREVLLDIEQGADIVMVKPAGTYVDIIREVSNISSVPVAAYQVSGEYSMIKASSMKGWINHDDAVLESIYAIKRAGAKLIATYFAKDIARLLR